MAGAKPHATGKVKPGDTTQRVGVEQLEARGVNVKQLIEKLIDAAGAEFTTYYYYTILRMYLAGHEDYKEICEDARLEDRAHFELITPRIYELGGSIPRDIRDFADRAGCADGGQHPDRPARGGALRRSYLVRGLRPDLREGLPHLRHGVAHPAGGDRAR